MLILLVALSPCKSEEIIGGAISTNSTPTKTFIVSAVSQFKSIASERQLLQCYP
jgi:hypothetical protein